MSLYHMRIWGFYFTYIVLETPAWEFSIKIGLSLQYPPVPCESKSNTSLEEAPHPRQDAYKEASFNLSLQTQSTKDTWKRST